MNYDKSTKKFTRKDAIQNAISAYFTQKIINFCITYPLLINNTVKTMQEIVFITTSSCLFI